MSIEAMKLALKALNEWRVEWSPDFYEEKYDSDEPEENTRRTLVKSAITALHQVIEQAQKQEPVAWRHDMGEENGGWEYFEEASCPDCQPLYTSPLQRQWVGLTEDEAFACQGRDYFETYKAIEAKLKEKNA